jgi:ferredoxin--NADP+ reductase
MTSYKILSNRQLSAETFVLRSERPKSPIIAGQCFSVGTSNLRINREYSMYSGASDPYVDFLIRRIDGGTVSSELCSLQEGDEIEIGGPYGDFCLAEDSIAKKRFVFIASGTGIAPFHSFYKTYPDLNFEILHGIRFEGEDYDSNVYPIGRYKSYVSKPEKKNTPQRVTDELSKRKIKEDEIYYLCGNRSMIIDCIQILRSQGIHGDAIYTETFF